MDIANFKKIYSKIKANNFYIKNKNFINIVLIVILLTSILIPFRYKTDIQFEYWKTIGKDKSLQVYFDNNYLNESKKDYILKAIDKLTAMNSEFGFKTFEEKFADSKTPLYLRSKLLDMYLANQERSPKLNVLLDLIFKEELDTTKLKLLIAKSDISELEAIVIGQISKDVAQDDWSELYEFIGKYNDFNLPKINTITVIYEKLDQLYNMQNTLNEIQDSILKEEEMYNKSKLEYEQLKVSLENIKNEKANFLIKFKEAEYLYNSGLNGIEYDFYIIGLLSEENGINLYEVCPARYDYYGNRQISMDRANLYTRDINYTSKGWASISSISAGSEKVKLKEDLGGFIQEWPIYIETNLYKDTFGKSTVDTYNLAKKNYEDAEKSYNNYINSESVSNNTLNEYYNKLQELKTIYSASIINHENETKKNYKEIKGILNISFVNEVVKDQSKIKIIANSSSSMPIKKESADRREFGINDTLFGQLMFISSNIQDAKSKLGKPLEIEKDFYEGEYYAILTYPDFLLSFSSQNGESETDLIFSGYEIINNKTVGPRGMRVGDSVNDILIYFPDDNNKVIENIKFLYGNDDENNGKIYYDENTQITNIYFTYYINSNDGYSMALDIINNKISEISLQHFINYSF